MARPKSYRDLIVWQKAMTLARHAYVLTNGLPHKEKFGLVSQIRRAAVSVPSNIAEGHGRLTDLQFRHFLGNARGSLNELETEVELAADLGYVGRNHVNGFMNEAAEVARLINALVASIQRSSTANRASSAHSANSANSANSASKGFRQ